MFRGYLGYLAIYKILGARKRGMQYTPYNRLRNCPVVQVANSETQTLVTGQPQGLLELPGGPDRATDLEGKTERNVISTNGRVFQQLFLRLLPQESAAS
jgi:hypothetical protein